MTIASRTCITDTTVEKRVFESSCWLNESEKGAMRVDAWARMVPLLLSPLSDTECACATDIMAENPYDTKYYHFWYPLPLTPRLI